MTPFGPIADPNPWGPIGDLRLLPDPATRVRPDPWPEASLPCTSSCGDAVRTDGSPRGACPRTFLKAALLRLERVFRTMAPRGEVVLQVTSGGPGVDAGASGENLGTYLGLRSARCRVGLGETGVDGARSRREVPASTSFPKPCVAGSIPAGGTTCGYGLVRGSGIEADPRPDRAP
jgi:hypothetical protein